MATQIRKVVNALPATLEANTMYAVRSGFGYKMVVTNSAGTVAYTTNQLVEIDWAPRWTVRANGNWTGFGTNRGHRETNLTVQYGAGTADPTIDHQTFGPILRPGQRLVNFELSGTVNNAQLVAFQYRLFFQYGPFPNWDASNTTRVELLTRNISNQGAGVQFRSNIETLNYDAPAQGYLLMFVKSNAVLTADRFARISCKAVIEQRQIL